MKAAVETWHRHVLLVITYRLRTKETTMSLISKIGKKGRIRNGKYAGFFVRIEDDSQNTGGYLILRWQDVPSVGYDHWVENLADLEQYMNEAGWDIEWLQ